MVHVVEVDEQGQIIYDGLLSSQEKADVDEILTALKEEIPKIESELSEKYGRGVMYKYYLGKVLSTLLDKYEITVYEQRRFWDEIKNLATNEDRKRNEGTNSVHRSFYQQCYVLSQQEIDVVNKLTWRQWQDLLDRVGNREDSRIFVWIKNYNGKIREDDWREFEKALHMYLKDKDTSVFEDEELFEIYDSIMQMCQVWRENFKTFADSNPKSLKIKSKSKWSKKYYSLCFAKKKELRSKIITKEICYESFNELFYNG